MSNNNNYNNNVKLNTTMNLTSILDNLENGNYLTINENNSIIKTNTKRKIEEFNNWLNGYGRNILLKSNNEDNEIYLYLLKKLKESVGLALKDIQNSNRNKFYKYNCKKCNEAIVIKPWENFWKIIQNHEHFEELLIETDNDLTDDDTESIQSLPSPSKTIETNGMVNKGNDFKLNFTINNDKRIESLLYPDSIVSTVRKLDKINDITIQRCGPFRAICLLCPCNLIGKGKITTFVITSHVNGQRHLKASVNPINKLILEKYHSYWRKQDIKYQLHQVYFVTDTEYTLRCNLCSLSLQFKNVLAHIDDNIHKSNILKVHEDNNKLTSYYLIDSHLEQYGIATEENPSKEKTCVIIKVTDIPNGNNIEDLLQQRYRQHAKCLSRTNNDVTCNVCKTNLGSDVEMIRKHVQNEKHRELSGLPISKYKYYCEICNYHFLDECSWEGHFTLGPNRHLNVATARKDKLAEYECITCLLVIYGDEISINRHIIIRHKSKFKKIQLSFSIKRIFKNEQSINYEGNNLTIEAKQVWKRQKIMWDCCESLQIAIRKIYPNCRAYPFGSRISGLGNNKSDLDVFMDIGDMYIGNKNQDSESQENFVRKSAKLLKKIKDEFHNVFAIPNARTPIIKLHHFYTKLDCDVSFRHGLSVENTKFLRFCIELQPITQPFILLLKKWSNCCKLNEHITNYGLALMAVFYLQSNNYLLSIKKLRQFNSGQSLIIDGWETINYSVPVETLKKHIRVYLGDLKQLLKEFFLYFSIFNYANDVVCPLLGYTIPKELFGGNGENLPIEMKAYVERLQNEDGEVFRSLSQFCIQDPFDLSHNLTKACQQGTIMRWKTLCKLTYEFLNTE